MTFKKPIPTSQKTLHISHKYPPANWEIYQCLQDFMIDLPKQFVAVNNVTLYFHLLTCFELVLITTTRVS